MCVLVCVCYPVMCVALLMRHSPLLSGQADLTSQAARDSFAAVPLAGARARLPKLQHWPGVLGKYRVKRSICSIGPMICEFPLPALKFYWVNWVGG